MNVDVIVVALPLVVHVDSSVQVVDEMLLEFEMVMGDVMNELEEEFEAGRGGAVGPADEVLLNAVLDRVMVLVRVTIEVIDEPPFGTRLLEFEVNVGLPDGEVTLDMPYGGGGLIVIVSVMGAVVGIGTVIVIVSTGTRLEFDAVTGEPSVEEVNSVPGTRG